MKEDYQKPWKKLTFFSFWTHNLLMEKVIKKERGLELVTSPSSGYETSSQKFLYYILPDHVWWFNIKRCFSYFKNYTWKFMQVISWNHKLFHLHLSFWIWKVRKGRGKYPKLRISLDKKELFRWNKKYFLQFLKGYHLVEKSKFDKK